MSEQKNTDKTLLVVDDDDILRDAIAFDFKRRGYHVLCAENGNIALDIVRSKQVDVVITDVRMPHCSGVELLDKIKELNCHIPVVIFVTGFADLTLEEAYAKGACAVMSKPFDRKALLETVQKSLQSDSEKYLPSSPPPEHSILIEIPSASEGTQTNSVCIGQGGVFLKLDHPVAQIGQIVQLKIKALNPAIPNLEGYGVVRWVRDSVAPGLPPGIGVEFAHFDESCRASIVHFLKNLMTKAYIPLSP